MMGVASESVCAPERRWRAPLLPVALWLTWGFVGRTSIPIPNICACFARVRAPCACGLFATCGRSLRWPAPALCVCVRAHHPRVFCADVGMMDYWDAAFKTALTTFVGFVVKNLLEGSKETVMSSLLHVIEEHMLHIGTMAVVLACCAAAAWKTRKPQISPPVEAPAATTPTSQVRRNKSPARDSRELVKEGRRAKSPAPNSAVDQAYDTALQKMHDALTLDIKPAEMKDMLLAARLKLKRAVPPDYRNCMHYTQLCDELLQELDGDNFVSPEQLPALQRQLNAQLTSEDKVAASSRPRAEQKVHRSPVAVPPRPRS